MPGTKYASICNPKQYRSLRRAGYSKEQAARISNAQSCKAAGVMLAGKSVDWDVVLEAITLKHPGHGNQKVHGRRKRGGSSSSAPAPAPSSAASGGAVTQGEWNRRFRKAETDARGAEREYASASAAAGAPGLSASERRRRQAESDSAQQRLQAAYGRMNEVSATPVAAKPSMPRNNSGEGTKKPVTQREWNRMHRDAEGKARSAEAEYARASAAAGARGIGAAERRRRQAAADKAEKDLQDAYARMREVSAIPVGPATKAASTLTVFKDATGRDRWASISSTAYRDRDGEIVSTTALKGAVALADATGDRGPLRFWHVPGLDIGDCDYQAVTDDGRFLIESGTFRKPAYAAALKAAGRPYHVSIGFTHPATEPVGGVFKHIAIFERSIVPDGRASNLFTRITTKERTMPLPAEKHKALEALFGPDGAAALLGLVDTTDKAAQAAGVAFKDTPAIREITVGGHVYTLKAEEPASEITIDGRTYTLKAPMPPAEMLQAAATEAADAVERAEDDEAVVVTDDMDLADLTVGQFKSLLGLFLGEVKQAEAGMADLKAQYEAIGKTFGAMQAQKDSTAAELATVKEAAVAAARLATGLDKRLKELEGDTAPVLKAAAPTIDPSAVMPAATLTAIPQNGADPWQAANAWVHGGN